MPLGLTEPTIQPHGRKDNEILVQLPGEGDPTRAKQVIQAGGQLELRLVEDPNSLFFGSCRSRRAWRDSSRRHGNRAWPRQNPHSQNPQDAGENWYVLSRTPVVTGRDLRSATENRNTKCPVSGKSTSFSPVKRRAASAHSPNRIRGRQMAIVLEQVVYSAPVIKSRIEDSG